MKALNRRLGNVKHLVFMDFEGTQYTHEVISIGAHLAKIDKNGRVVTIKKGFYVLVKAREKVSKFIENLTGISQSDIEKNAIDFSESMRQFRKYVGKAWESCKFVAYGFNDILMLRSSVNHQPRNETTTGIVEYIGKNYFDFQAFFAQYVKDDQNNNLSLNNGLIKFDIQFEGVQHNALADAKNLLSLYDAFQSNYLVVSNEYKRVLSNNQKLPRPVAKVMKALNEGKVVTPELYKRMIEDEIND